MTEWEQIWYESYEGGVASWVNEVGFHVQSSERAKVGTYSGKQYDNVYSRTISVYREFGETVTKKLKVDLWMKPEPTLYSGEAWYVSLSNGATAILTICLYGSGAGSGDILWYNGSIWNDTGLDWFIGTPWMHLIMEVDFDAGTIDLWVSDAAGTLQKATSTGFRVADPSVGVNRIYRTGYLLWAAYNPCWFWDEVKIYKEAKAILPIVNPYELLIGGLEKNYIKIHYVKTHPSEDPNTFDILVNNDVGELLNYFDTVEIVKNGVTEYYGFIEEITPQKGENGLDYLLTGRCWKLVPWKKQICRYQESREIGPANEEGDLETGFFGNVYPHELFKFLLRCPISEHPKGKVRHKIGWGIASDFWKYRANLTADAFYPDWVGLRYTGLSWRGRASMENLHVTNLICNNFDSTYTNWAEYGSSPYLHTDSESDRIAESFPISNSKEGYFGFDDLGVTANVIYRVKLYVKGTKQRGSVWVYLNDGTTDYLIGSLYDNPYSYTYYIFDVTNILDTTTKVNNAKIYFKATAINETGWVGIIYAYLNVEYSTTTDDEIWQHNNDWFIVDVGGLYEDVTAILIECRNNPIMYARNYKIQYCILSNCASEDYPPPEDNWLDFTPAIVKTNNEARDILHSWKPEDVRCIRIKLIASSEQPWEISQIYVWQADNSKYRVLNE